MMLFSSGSIFALESIPDSSDASSPFLCCCCCFIGLNRFSTKHCRRLSAPIWVKASSVAWDSLVCTTRRIKKKRLLYSKRILSLYCYCLNNLERITIFMFRAGARALETNQTQGYLISRECFVWQTKQLSVLPTKFGRHTTIYIRT